MILLDGKSASMKIKEQIAVQTASFISKGGKIPHLCAIIVGEDGASKTYVASKEKSCSQVGFKSTVIRMPEETTECELLEKVKEINEDSDVDGLIVQLPLPAHIDDKKVIMAIDPHKDVDGFHPVNVGKGTSGMPGYISATPYGIVSLLSLYGINTSGMHCVVLERSNIVGRPIANLLSQKSSVLMKEFCDEGSSGAKIGDCTVTICHSRTNDIASYTRQADIIIAAIGIPEFLKADMVKEGAIVIDVGITRLPAPETPKGYRIVGDVDFNAVAPKCSYITPVPGGVGLMTVVSLLRNTLRSAMDKCRLS